MKKTKKVMVSALTVAMLVANCGLTACDEIRRDTGEEIDRNRIQIECALQDTGMGSEWLNNLKERFERDYPKAQVRINIVTTELDSTQIDITLKNSNYDVLYVNETRFDLVKGNAYNVTNLMLNKAYDEKGETTRFSFFIF